MRTSQNLYAGPRFARVSVIVFTMLLPIVVYTIWDYVEMRRLRTRIETIVARGEPTTAAALRPPKGDAADAARYYAAASALVGGYIADVTATEWSQLTNPQRKNEWSTDLINRARDIVAGQAEALTLLDRAAALPFDGFPSGAASNSLVANLSVGARLCQIRAELLAQQGQADAAANSLHTGIRLARVTNQLMVFPELALLVQRRPPSPAALAQLRDALAEIDHGDHLKGQFTRLRAMVIDRSYNVRVSDGAGMSPWDSHRLNRRLDTFAALINAAEKPAAERRAAVMAVGEWPLPGISADLSRKQLDMQVSLSERQSAAIGCARRLVAGEVTECTPDSENGIFSTSP